MYLDNDIWYPKAEQSAIVFMDEINQYIGEYALGSETYSLGDVLTTSFLARLSFGFAFFEREVRQKRPKIYDYWLRVQ